MGIGKRIDEKEEEKPNNNEENKQKDDEVFVPEEPKFSFDDIILPQSVREQILNAADYAKNSKIVLEDWGLKVTHKYSKRIGVNLYDEPGTRKTLTTHAIAKNLGRKILAVNKLNYK